MGNCSAVRVLAIRFYLNFFAAKWNDNVIMKDLDIIAKPIPNALYDSYLGILVFRIMQSPLYFPTRHSTPRNLIDDFLPIFLPQKAKLNRYPAFDSDFTQ